MTRAWYSTAAVALLVVLAGCAGGISGGPATTTADTTATTSSDADAGGSADAGAATVQFYISDERNDIDDFESLEVTVTEIGFQRAGNGDGDESDGEETTATTTVNETTANRTTEAEDEAEEAEAEDEAEEAEEAEENEADGEDEREGWVTVDIEDRTVDLTELKGANASLLANVTIPDGTYTKVFIEVSETNGTLKNEETTNVKLPSERLQLNKRFTVGNNETVSFVYDVTAVKAGKSGKYILKPVVSQSGTDVPIDDVSERRGPPEDRERGDRGEGGEDRDDREGSEDREEREDRERGDSEQALNVSVDGEVAPNETVTLTVTRNGSAVANATVSLNGEVAGTTADDGTFTFTVPDVAELAVTVEGPDGESEAELEYEFETEETDGDEQDGSEQGDRGGQGGGDGGDQGQGQGGA